jgi:protein-tyrosine phosphatase
VLRLQFTPANEPIQIIADAEAFSVYDSAMTRHTGRIDVHAHLIPGIDDGCPTLDDALACARQFVGAGYSVAFCTPHVWPQLPRNEINSIREGTARLQAELDRAKIPLRLFPGGEISLESGWPELGRKPLDQIVTYGLAGCYLLFDFWADQFEGFLLPAVKYLQSLSLKLIMAHPERLEAVQKDPSLAMRFLDMGLLLQCNSWCLLDPPGAPTREIAERLLLDGRYFLLATDCHNSKSLPVRLRGIDRAIELIGAQAVDQLTIHNPAKLLPAM